ncbi:hypothetical protein E1A91_A13G059100v1, partial [Gossypium mustelinum]
YIKAGPYQPILSEYLTSSSKKHPRYFQPSWFKHFSFNPSSRFRPIAFTHSGFSNCGFSNWKKVHDGFNCAFLKHKGKGSNSLHNNAQRAYVDLMNQAQHIEVSLDRQTTQQIAVNCLCLKTSIDVVRWLSFQGCAFRGHDESFRLKNHGNFLEFLSLLALYDEKVEDVLKSAPQNTSYTSSTIQKKILQIYANRVRNVIREEIGDRKFSIIVSEARGESKKEKMASILKFVDKQGHTCLILLWLLPNGTINYKSPITSLLKMYNATSMVLENLKNTASNYSQRGDAHNAYNKLRFFKFIFILHIMKEVLGVIDNIFQAWQSCSQDILNAISLVLTTKDLIQKLEDDGWNEFLKNVISFCETLELDFPDMNAQFIVGRSHNKKEDVTVEHQYRVNIFFATIDTELQELKSMFNEHVVELLTLTTTLDPKEFFKLFDIDKIFILVNTFYLEDISHQEKKCLPYELKHYELDACKHPDLRKISTLSKLCKSLVERGNSVMYPFADRLIHLILTLPVSTTSSE